MRLILEFQNKGSHAAVWIHYGNIETEVFDGHITIALEVYEHLKRYAMERSGLPDYQYFEDSSETILRLFESRLAA
jgi:hypothetical protein